MKQIAQYADGIGPDYHMLVGKDATKENPKLTAMVTDAHAVKMVVHPYTIRVDALPDYVSNGDQLYDLIYNKAGVDGVFTDFPDKGVQFLEKQGQHK